MMRNIWKSFPGVVANRGADLSLDHGEVHSLLGENGAGKTTLMNILSGTYRADAGKIIIEGREVEIHSPTQAISLGIGMVHQNFRLVDNMTVTENVHLGWKETPWFISPKLLAHRLNELSSDFKLKVDPDAQIWQLSVGEQQRVEILKVLTRGARVLILDEPTSVLTPGESAELFKVLRDMALKGKTIVFISHKLDEVLEVSDRITVLRGGVRMATKFTTDCDPHLLARLMVGQDVIFNSYKHQGQIQKPILEIKNVSAKDDRGLPALRDVNLEVRQREILGVAGVSGNGQRELAEVLTGMRRIKEGSIMIAGVNQTGKSARQYARAGVGHIPGDRLGMGLFPILSIKHNTIVRRYLEPPIQKGMLLIENAAIRLATQIVEQAAVRIPNLNIPVQNLSGGNQQRLVVRREIEIASKILVAVLPTRGLDVAATEDVRKTLVEFRNHGNGIILISEDLDEILLLSDRIAVIFEGRIVGLFDHAKANREKIGLLMAGRTNEKESRL